MKIKRKAKSLGVGFRAQLRAVGDGAAWRAPLPLFPQWRVSGSSGVGALPLVLYLGISELHWSLTLNVPTVSAWPQRGEEPGGVSLWEVESGPCWQDQAEARGGSFFPQVLEAANWAEGWARSHALGSRPCSARDPQEGQLWWGGADGFLPHLPLPGIGAWSSGGLCF